ncbi:hypothetical protein RIF29_18350 [Crotalaria pallida]|uniref:Uncharacterized protein n=1 Tax=Crotalaria pallida TaxID=3830 RepID=A0AAN9FIW7_CROPI
MESVLPGSFLRASSITTGGSCRRTREYTKNYHPSSYASTFWNNTGKIQKECCVIISSRHNLKHHYQLIEGRPKCPTRDRKYVVKAASGQSFECELQNHDTTNFWNSLKDSLDVFYRFSRPYAAVGAVLGSTSASLLAVKKLSNLLSPTFFMGWLQVLVASIIMNVFHCGLNQLCDVEIDKINKPYLPLASGDLSFKSGVIIVASSLILNFGLAWMVGSWPLFWGLFISAACAPAYSMDLPFLRWKKSPVLTAINFLINCAAARPIGYFLHMQTHVFKRSATFPRQLILYMAILSVFYIVIALFKDIPDIEGDKKFGIKSLAIRLGQKRVFWICISLLEMAYGIIILIGATSPFLWSKIFTVLGHATLALFLWNRGKSVDLKSNVSLQSFYMVIWKLLYAEHLLIPLFR